MKALVVLVTLAVSTAGADLPAWRVGVSCDGVVPEHMVIEALGPGRLVIRLGDLFEHCVANVPESHRWRAGS